MIPLKSLGPSVKSLTGTKLIAKHRGRAQAPRSLLRHATDELNIYMYSSGGVLVKQWWLGDSAQRGYEMGDMLPAVHFQLDIGERATMYLQVSTTGIPVMPIWLLDNKSFIKSPNCCI